LTSNLISTLGRSVGLSTVMRAAGLATRLVPIEQPILLVGPGASERLGQAVAAMAHQKILLVTDAVVAELGLHQGVMQALSRAGTACCVLNNINADAPLPEIENGLALYRAQGCDAVIGVGGGSVLDAAKAIALAATNDKPVRALVGYVRAWHAPAPLYAVPTTAGTGSEVSVVAVISDPVGQRKLVITDPRLVPRMAALDPCLMTGLPAPVTAATGLDALTHAIEAFIGHWSTAYTDRMALAAVGMIFDNLGVAFKDGHNLAAREQMALAASYAGLAFTRASVGYVHAIAHQLGARYHTPHGLANAIMLVPVLRFYGPVIHDQLALLAVRTGLGSQDEPATQLAHKFLAALEALQHVLGMAPTLASLRKEDIPALAQAACREADTNYPVPRYMSVDDCATVIASALPHSAPRARQRTPRPKRLA
jgi:alcohol dehydrogenase